LIIEKIIITKSAKDKDLEIEKENIKIQAILNPQVR